MRRSRLAAALCAGLLCVTLTACSSKATAGGGAEPGITADTVRLGIITPLTGPLGGLGAAGVTGAQIFWDRRNEAGGVCGRRVELQARDNKYSTQGSVTQYAALRGEVAAIANLAPGSDVLALQDRLRQDDMLVMAGSYEPTILGAPNAAIPGSPYDVEAINGISYLVEERVLKPGDTVGVIAYPSGIGRAVTAGTTHAAQRFGLRVEQAEIAPTDTDATSQVSTLRRAGARAIVMGTSGSQVVSAASVARSTGYDVTIQATNLLSEADLRGPARDALVEHVVLTSNSAPLSSNAPAVSELLAEWQRRKGGQPITTPAQAGYLMAQILTSGMERACAGGELTRAGILRGLAGTGPVDTRGMGVHLDYSRKGEPPSRESFILRPRAGVPGGAALVRGAAASEAARSYRPAG